MKPTPKTSNSVKSSPMNGNNPLGRAVQPSETFGKKAPEIAKIVESAIRNEPPKD